MSRYFLVLILIVCGTASFAQQGKVHKLSNVRWPDYNEQGDLLSEITGTFAVIREDGLIDITDLVMLLYHDGVVHTRITAPQCLFDKENMTAVSDDRIKVEREEMNLSGKGFQWNAKTGRLEIQNEAKVVFTEINFDNEQEKHK